MPARFVEVWQVSCLFRAVMAMTWREMKPFDRNDLAEGREILSLLRGLLAWEGRHLIRWASSILCGDSKMRVAAMDRHEPDQAGLIRRFREQVRPSLAFRRRGRQAQRGKEGSLIRR